MGVVWARQRLQAGRDVAIKVLPDLFVSDPERLARFEREARLLASLNNPHIASIYALHSADGVRFLAMELVEGEDLAQRLQRGATPIPEAVPIALQVAQALEHAHERAQGWGNIWFKKNPSSASSSSVENRFLSSGDSNVSKRMRRK